MTLDELHTKWEAQEIWMKKHPVKAAFINVYNFVLYRIPALLEDAKYSVIYAKDRVFRGYDDRMVFDYYSENARQTIKVLKHLRLHRNGSPVTALSDACKNEKECKCEDTVHEDWNIILNTMIAGFEAMEKYSDVHITTDGKYDREKSEAEEKRLFEIWEKGMKEYTQNYRGLWD